MLRIESFPNSEGKIEKWWREGILIAIKHLDNYGHLHRLPREGPAFSMYYNDGKILCEKYYIHGIKHRDSEEGPAYLLYNQNGKVEQKVYWENGECLS